MLLATHPLQHAHPFAADRAFFLIARTVVASAAPVAPIPPQQFAGTREAKHHNKVIIVLQLHTEADHFPGTIQLAGFQIDFEGGGTAMAVTDSQLDEPINLKNIKLNGRILSFDFVDGDGDNDKLQMELIDSGAAKLQWVDLPSGFKALPSP